MCSGSDRRLLSRVLDAASKAAAGGEDGARDGEREGLLGNRRGHWDLPPHLRPSGIIPEIPPEGSYV